MSMGQVAFASVITDYTLFTYLADVIVWPTQRGLGIGKKLIVVLLDHPELATATSFLLRTLDATAAKSS